MTTFLLIRHALCDPVGHSIAGRQQGVHLNAAGRHQASRLAERLEGVSLEAIYSSPLERARETAEPIGRAQRIQVQTVEAWNEIDFGEWTGRALNDLEPEPEWKRFNSSRSSCTIPGGENMADVLSRVLRDLDRLRCLHPAQGSCVGVVSHGDVLRTLVAHVLGIPLDFFHRLEISPASVTVLEMSGQVPRVLLLNSTDGWPGAIGTPR